MQVNHREYKMENKMERINALLEKPCFIMDYLPEQVKADNCLHDDFCRDHVTLPGVSNQKTTAAFKDGSPDSRTTARSQESISKLNKSLK